MIDFLNDLRTDIIKRLDQYGVSYRETMDLERLSIQLFTFLHRYIDPHRRQVFVSKELLAAMPQLPEQIQQAVEKMKVWISEGVDINCFQSRGLYSGKSRDYQGVLYGIGHLHLSAKKDDQHPVIKNGRFAKPSDHVLFVYFTKECAFFLTVVKHPGNGTDDFVQWVERKQYEIILDNWPSLLEKRALKGFKPCDDKGQVIDLCDEDISALIKGNINMPICIRDLMFFPERGIAGSGDDALAVRESTKLHNRAVRAELEYKEREREIQNAFVMNLDEDQRLGPIVFDIHFVYSEELEKYVVMDMFSGSIWDFQKDSILRSSAGAQPHNSLCDQGVLGMLP